MHQPDLPERYLGEIPDLVEPVLGWRVWRVWAPPAGSDSSPILSSVILDMPWTPRRKMTAEHSPDLSGRCSGLLESGCSCGVYAFRSADDAFAYLVKVRDRLMSMSVEVSLGTVSLWGRVVECERGYKAQFAYPHHIYLPVRIARLVPEVSAAFGVPVGVYSSAREEEISIPVPAGLGSRKELLLKNAHLLSGKDLPYQAELYDQAALPVRMGQPPSS